MGISAVPSGPGGDASRADPAARKKLYVDVQKRLVDLSPMVFLYSSTQYEAARKAVQGYAHFPNTSYIGLRTAWLKR